MFESPIQSSVDLFSILAIYIIMLNCYIEFGNIPNLTLLQITYSQLRFDAMILY